MDFVWSDSFTKDESRLIVQNAFPSIPLSSKIVIYHARTPSYKYASRHRDGYPLSDRPQLLNYLLNQGFHIIIFGISNVKAPFSNQITYLSDFNSLDSSLQLHCLNAATYIIGNISGVTTLSAFVKTPSLWIDYSLPSIPFRIHPSHQYLLKNLFYNGEKQNVSHYFSVPPVDYLDLACHQMHPLENIGFTLEPNSDSQIIAAIIYGFTALYTLQKDL